MEGLNQIKYSKLPIEASLNIYIVDRQQYVP